MKKTNMRTNKNKTKQNKTKQKRYVSSSTLAFSPPNLYVHLKMMGGGIFTNHKSVEKRSRKWLFGHGADILVMFIC